LPGDGGDLLGGLAIGDTSAVDDDLDRAMKQSSLSHLTAVSGANCAIVIGLFMAAGAALGVPRWARIAASLLVLLAFVILVTPEPSVLRAALMAALVLAALQGGRPVRGIPVLALATLCLLIADPWLARSFGFGLSVLATAGLLVLAAPLARAIARWLPSWLALVIAVPTAAQLACQPVIILLNAALPSYGVVANLLAAPAAPLATVAGLAACVLLLVVPPLGALLCQLAWFPSAWIAAVAQFFSSLPGAQLPWLSGATGAVALAALSVVIVFAAVGRRWAAVALTVTIVGYAGVVGGGRVADQLARPANWQIAACDVGQGDAVFVRSAGRLALIDTGPVPERLENCMSELGVGRIDLLVLTHYDLDHVGGATAVVGMVDTVLVGPSGDPEDDLLRAQFAAAGARVQQVSRGPSGILGELRWRVLWPPTRLVGFEPGNPASVTLEFTGVGECTNGCLSSIFLGDLGRDAQNRLLAAGTVDSVDVVKVAHHGSADQSERLYERLAATVGVIGVGTDNGYGHPTESLLSVLADVGTAPLRTDTGGMLLLAPGSDPGTVRVWTQH
ncbi:MAG: ComEC/Rec2 family competence protein, partial [Rhodoglobus sp.]|nr:ComEC/Rec2 family competence protein [Rhodoglobus sp.]